MLVVRATCSGNPQARMPPYPIANLGEGGPWYVGSEGVGLILMTVVIIIIVIAAITVRPILDPL